MAVQLIVDMLGLGTFYALLTLGVALLFGVLGLMNFAYGEILMVSAFVMFVLREQPYVIAVLGAIMAGVTVALLTERFAFKPLRQADPVTLMIASFAVSLMVQSLARITVLPRAQGVPPREFMSRTISVWGASISMLQILTVVICGAAIGAVAFVLQRTSLGVQLRAAAENFQMARILGVRSGFVMLSAFAMVGVIAAISSAIFVAQQGAVTAEMGLTPLLVGVVGAVLGGMRSLKGAALGGFLLGALSSVLEALLPGSLVPFRDAFLYAAVIGLLVVRPEGLLASKKVRVS